MVYGGERAKSKASGGSAGKWSYTGATGGVKLGILELSKLGYGVLLSDVDIVYLQNPFDGDSDVESMSDDSL
ncbi:hypothetical protein H5410_019578, partial [Solanum commersonii]